MNELMIEDVRKMQLLVADAIIENREFLGEIDRKIGDGDHGEGMYIGFSSAKKYLIETNEYKSLGDLYKNFGMALLSSMGGASGVLFASIYISLAEEASENAQLTNEIIVNGFKSALESIKNRGGAQPGDKTMIDALQPAVEKMQVLVENGDSNIVDLLYQAKIGSESGVEETKKMISRHGRSKSLGERSFGFQDAGATSVSIIFDSMWKYTKKVEDTL